MDYEAQSLARLALFFGPENPSFATLKDLAFGSMDWLCGMHYGVRGRYVLPPSDREWECGSFFVYLGSAHVVQHTWGAHYWLEPSLLAGPGGELEQMMEGWPFGPEQPPWTLTPQNPGNTEPYIRRDGLALMAAETVSRLLHPLRSYEAEDADVFTTAQPPVIESNNAPGYPNGGLSVVGILPGDKYGFDVSGAKGPPDPDPGPRQYWISLRTGNPTGTALTANVTVSEQGQTIYSQALTIPPTAHLHDYAVTTASVPVTLDNAGSYWIEVLFVAAGISFDDFVLKSRGQ